jgi:hypothetical protein
VVVRTDGLDVDLARPDRGLDPASVERAVAGAVVAAGARTPAVRVQVVDGVPRTAGGKASRVTADARDVSNT